MKRIVTALIAIVLSAGPAVAQGPTDSGSPLYLLSKDAVRKELNLSEAQAATVKMLAADVQADPTKEAAALETLNKTLKLAQMKRLNEISYQVRGGAALGDDQVANVIGLSDKQKAAIRDIWVNSEKTLRMLLSVARFRTPQVRVKYIANHRRQAGEKMLAVLADEQKKQFEQLKGKPFNTAGLDSE